MPTTQRIALLFLFAATAALLAAGPALAAPYGTTPAPVEAASYSYVRVLDGAATLTVADSGDREQVELNQPVLSGDRVWVSPRSRLELVLSDLNVLRLDADTEVALDQLAYSPEGRDVVTSVRLLSGNLQLEVSDESLGEDPPTIELPFATVYVMEPGSYRITCYEYGVCWVVSRDGAAEVVTDRGSVLLRRDEAVYLEQEARGSAYAEAAPARDDLERWGERLTIEARRADLRGVDPSLRYGAAPLAEHGDWVEVDSSWAWRPSRVSHDWRPYWDGHWRYTPSGLLWVSSEPWGWTTYHYGTWNRHPHHGWVWHPGHVFAPAWVYWYWGPSQVAWVPAGYYTHHYRPRYRGFDFHFGIYGYAGGSHHHYRDWIFCDIDRFGRRHDFRRHLYSGRDFERRHRGSVVPRGVITTDTRGLSSDRWQRSVDVLEERSRRVALPRNGVQALPDVTPFVARDELPETVQRRVVTPRRGATRVSAEGMPFETPDVRERPNVRERPDVEGSEPGARRRAAVTRGQGGDRSATEPSTPRAQRPVISTDAAGGRGARDGRAVGGDANHGEPTRRRVFVRPDGPQRAPDAAPRLDASGRTDERAGATRSPSARSGSDRGGVTRRPDVRQRAFEPRQPAREAAPQEGAPSERRRVFVRPDGRTRVGGGDAPRSSTRGSDAGSRSEAGRRPVIRPSTPQRRDGRDSTGTTERPVRPSPAWRPGPSERRPSVRPSSPTSRRPAVRPSSPTSRRPTVRPSAPRSRPEARPAPRDSRRPEARSSRPSTSRGSEARGGGSRSSRRPEASSGSGGSRNRSSASSSRGSNSRRGSASGSRGGARRRSGGNGGSD